MIVSGIILLLAGGIAGLHCIIEDVKEEIKYKNN